ncbi:phosphoglucosamine mutase [Mucilaginibacter sp. BJC16-A38]|uniref:phosphoglucosamine mutase n=1 Tax=Mucilaginibacter phenanthrenivorans TaxID=1234842 RepID=UPI0021587CBF|nr:phosphoglucosamine mutase [Mucilaginibacter phenanthrenivorans]MCR8557185.1 phosphoglucosamine mutase [Mucilaginibacter phenanthrenivorans]
MTLIKSISGIRGTIGGKVGENLTPLDIVKFTSAFGCWAVRQSGIRKIVVGRDARISGSMVNNLVVGTLQGLGIDVIDLGLSTTPTVEIAVPAENAAGGIILTASHNPKQWNALKLLNHRGEFINHDDGKMVLDIAENCDFDYANVDKLGNVIYDGTYMRKHIDRILALPLVDAAAIGNANLKIVVDAVNSTGGFFVPALLKALGVKTIYQLYCEPDGNFAHDPEPLPENLSELSKEVLRHQADLGIAVDPDVDRLCFVSEDGSKFGEEYTLVAVADYVLKYNKGNTVSNLSSTRALKDITERTGAKYYAAAVGEVNVVNKMKEVDALIGGEGNGGIIYPELHYGRDALVGIALFLTHLVRFGKPVSALRSTYPDYFMSKNKLELDESVDIELIIERVKTNFSHIPQNMIDGLKIDFDHGWVHLRRSNTEPVIRIYAEAKDKNTADGIIKDVMKIMRTVV